MTSLPAYDILGFGAVAVDDLLYVDEYPPADGKVRVRHRLRQCGGLTGTALVAAARLGARCAYVGVLGDDELAQVVIDRLTAEGIDVQHCVRRPEVQTCHSTIVVDQTHHTRTIFASLHEGMGADPSRPCADVIRAARVVLVDHHGIEGTIRAARIAREVGIGVVADLERRSGDQFDELLRLVDHLVVSEGMACHLTGENRPDRAAERLFHADRHAVVVTCGRQGCWYVGAGGRAQHLAALPVTVVDTTGCGDVFHGAYAAALAQGEPLDRCVRIASVAAALKATQRGGQAGCPTRPAVEAFLSDT